MSDLPALTARVFCFLQSFIRVAAKAAKTKSGTTVASAATAAGCKPGRNKMLLDLE